MPRKKTSTPKIHPWPGSTFALKVRRDANAAGGLLWVYLERRAGGRFGRLEAMRAVIPPRSRRAGLDAFFASAQYRQNIWRGAVRVMDEAGVSTDQKNEFLAVLEQEYPSPTAKELFLEELEHPWVKGALGPRKKELSFFSTGVPVFTEADGRLIRESFRRKLDRLKRSPNGGSAVIAYLQRGPFSVREIIGKDGPA